MFTIDNTVKSAESYCLDKLNGVYSDREIRQIIRSIFSHLFDWNSADFLLRNNKRLSESDLLRLREAIKELQSGRPLQYVLGTVQFQDLSLEVNENVLIPRPETEELVRLIGVDCAGLHEPRILDIGTGSGCIALSLSSMFKQSTVCGVDVDINALQVAERNARRNGIEVNFKQLDILNCNRSELDQLQWDIIVSNPPYVLESDKSQMETNVLEFEPHQALFVPDNDALIFYDAILKHADYGLVAGGQIYFEIHENKGEQMKRLLEKYAFEQVEIMKDLFGKSRFVRGVKR